MLPSVMGLVLVAGILIYILPKRFVLIPFFIAASYMTLGQMIIIGPFNFTIVRLLVIFSISRALIRGEIRDFKRNGMDNAFIIFLFFLLITGVLLEEKEGLVNRLGRAWDYGGVFFTTRLFITNEKEIVTMIKSIAIIITPIAGCMLIEHFTGRNIFAVFGGVPEITMIRHGKLRCQGAFAHPILAGTAGATTMPLMLFLWLKGEKAKFISIIGFISCLVIVITSASSGPIMSFVFALVGMSFWPLRGKMKTIKRLLIVFLASVQLFMKVPVWFLIARIDLTGSSTGWHRAQLISSAIAHLSEWWLIGTTYTRHWMATGVSWSENHTDMTNHYLRFGVIGGLPTMLCFIAILVQGYNIVGKYIHFSEDNILKCHLLAWTLGSVLFAHTMTFFSISYFDQTNVFLYTVIGIIGTLEANRMAQQEVGFLKGVAGYS